MTTTPSDRNARINQGNKKDEFKYLLERIKTTVTEYDLASKDAEYAVILADDNPKIGGVDYIELNTGMGFTLYPSYPIVFADELEITNVGSETTGIPHPLDSTSLEEFIIKREISNLPRAVVDPSKFSTMSSAAPKFGTIVKLKKQNNVYFIEQVTNTTDELLEKFLDQEQEIGLQDLFGFGNFPNPFPQIFGMSNVPLGDKLNIIKIQNGKLYIVGRNQGVVGQNYWNTFRADFQNYVNQNYTGLGLRVDNLGITRDLYSSVYPSSGARVAGSKHGAGLAQDLYLHTSKYGEYTNYKEDNKVLAKDEELVRVIRNFIKTRPEIKWGGDFGGGQGTEVAARGILEFHHFEIKNSSMPAYFQPYAAEIQSVGYTDPVSSLTSTRELAKLYSLLLANSNRAS